jgi:hypothetical protein
MIGLASTGFKPYKSTTGSLIASLAPVDSFLRSAASPRSTTQTSPASPAASPGPWPSSGSSISRFPSSPGSRAGAWRLALYALAFGLLFLLARYTRTSRASAAGLFMAASVAAQYAKFMLIGFGGGILIAACESNLPKWLRPVWPARNWIALALFLAYLVLPQLPSAGQVLLLSRLRAHRLGRRSVRPARPAQHATARRHQLPDLPAARPRLLRGHAPPRRHPQRRCCSAYIAETALCLVTLLLLAALVHIALEQPAMRLSEAMAPATAAAQDATR